MTAMTERSAQFSGIARPSHEARYYNTDERSGLQRTILHLADTSLDIIQGQVADLILKFGEVHGEG